MSLNSLEGLLRVEERTVSGREKIYSAIEEDARDILRNPVFQEYYTSRNNTHQELKCIEVYNLGKECLKIQMDRMGITAQFWINNNSAETNLKNLNIITLSLIRNLHRIKLAEKGKSVTMRELEEIYKSRTKQNRKVILEQNCAIKQSNEENLPRSVLPSTQSDRIESTPNPEISSVPSKLPEPSGAKKGGGYSIKSKIDLVSPSCFNKYNAWVTSESEKVFKNDETKNHSEKEKKENDIIVEKVKELTEAFTALNDGKSKDEVTAVEDRGWSDEDEDCNATPKIKENLVQSRKITESNDSGFLYDPNCNTATENGSQIVPYPNSNSIHEIKPNTDLNDNSGLLSDSSTKLGQKIEPSSKGDSRDSGLNSVSNSDLKKTETSPGVPPSQPLGQLEPESDEDEFEPALKNIQENLSLADALKIPAVWRKIYMKGEPVPQSRKPLGVPGQFEDAIVQDSKQQNNTEIIDCFCNRSIRMIHCGLCGLTVEGRTRKVCYLHSNVTYLHDFTACPRCKTGLNHLKEYCLPKLRKTKPELGSEKKSSFQMKARSTASTILEKSRSSTPTVSQKTSSGHPTVEKKPSSCPSTECVKTKSGFSAIQEKPRSVPARVRRNIVM